MAYYYKRTDELYHHGILGQKWGVRRFQNKDGSLTPAGKERYLTNSNFKIEDVTAENVDKYLNLLGYDTPEYTVESRKFFETDDTRGNKCNVAVYIDGDYRSSNSKAQNVVRAAKTINDRFIDIEAQVRKDAQKSSEIQDYIFKHSPIWATNSRIFYNMFGTNKRNNEINVYVNVDENGIGDMSYEYDDGANQCYFYKTIDWKTGLFIKKHWDVVE